MTRAPKLEYHGRIENNSGRHPGLPRARGRGGQPVADHQDEAVTGVYQTGLGIGATG